MLQPYTIGIACSSRGIACSNCDLRSPRTVVALPVGRGWAMVEDAFTHPSGAWMGHPQRLAQRQKQISFGNDNRKGNSNNKGNGKDKRNCRMGC